MNFSLQIRSQRLAKGWTQAELARRCGIAQPNLAAFESGSRRPSLYTLSRLSEGLGVEAGRLLESRPSQVLDRFLMDKLARALVSGGPRPSQVPNPLWRDLQALFFSKLKALAPEVPRTRQRLSVNAAARRAKSWLGPEGLAELTRRFDKFYPESIR